MLGCLASSAIAAKQPVDYIGAPLSGALGGEFQGPPPGVAVNYSGAGGVPAGTVYATDGGGFDPGNERGNRVQRFQREDNGTPGNTSDDTYKFISAWGAGLESGGTNYEICTVAAKCGPGKGIGGNGASAGNGALSKPGGIVVDQDTGEVYVADSSARRTLDGNFRINVYSATGAFLRSFGWDVVESGPDDNGTGYEVCKAGLDVCKAGTTGSGIGQVGSVPSGEDAGDAIAVSPPDGNPATGTVFLGDLRNNRINTYGLDGSSPSSIGSSAVFSFRQPDALAVDSRGIVYASNGSPGGGGGTFTVERYDAGDANGGGVGFLAPISIAANALAVDPDADGPGPDTDVLYVGTGGSISQFGPINAPGLTTPPTVADEVHGGNGVMGTANGIAVEPATGRIYVAATTSQSSTVEGGGPGVFVLDEVGPAPTASLDSLSDPTSHSVLAHATIDPNGPPATSYHLEYSTDGVKWQSAPSAVLGAQETPQSIAATLDPPPAGLQPNTHYHVRLVAGRFLAEPIITSDLTFTTLGAPPLVETTGSPVRTATRARFDSRVSPRNSATTYHFEYGDQGPCDSNPCESTPDRRVGIDEVQEITVRASGGQFKLAFGGKSSGDLAFNASATDIQAALSGLSSIGTGNVLVSGGPGDLSGSKPYVVTFTGDLGAIDVAQIQASNGTTPLVSESGATVQTTVDGGDEANEEQKVTIKASSGQFKLGFGPDTTADISYNASSATVQSALGALPSIGSGNVLVSGGPGNATGSSPYVVTFVEGLAKTNVAKLTVSDGNTPLGGLSEASVVTTTPGGARDETFLVSQQLEGLQPATTYHYRVVADNGVGSPVAGQDMTLTTRASDAPLDHGHFPGPSGSDRAYEQVSLPDLGGNPIQAAQAISDDGTRVAYQVHGGNPVSNTGNAFNQLFAERTPGGWQTRDIFPAREDLVASGWAGLWSSSDLSALASLNTDYGAGQTALYRFSPSSPAQKVFQVSASSYPAVGASDDGSLLVMVLDGRAYDVSSGTLQPVDQAPAGSSGPVCSPILGHHAWPLNVMTRPAHWLSADGNFVFLPNGNCNPGPQQLYMRDIAAGETKRISPPPVSGPSCMTAFIRSTPGAAFYWTQSRLDPADSVPSACSAGASPPDGDVYRYALGTGSVKCVTCLDPGLDADVFLDGNDADRGIAIAEDGSRVYFRSPNALLAGTGPGVYRVNLESGSLAYVASGATVGVHYEDGQALSPDGKTLIFASSGTGVNALNGQQNGGTRQYYRYDDRDRSLVCVSCPQDGSTPFAAVKSTLLSTVNVETGPNITPMSEDGGTFAFATPNPLVGTDQNTAAPGQPSQAGTDVYEWRAGRLFLVTDGLTSWPSTITGSLENAKAPEVNGVSHSGKDIYFAVSAQYTPDALDGYLRLYDARIGGGFEYPPPPKPCPLEVCQGTQKGAPEEVGPGSASFAGAGNAKPQQSRHKKKKAHKKKRTHKKANHKRANHKRRAAR